MKLAFFIAIITVLGITTASVYTTVKKDHGFGCSQYWTYIGEIDSQNLDEQKLIESPLKISISEHVSGTIMNVNIRHSSRPASLSSSLFISNKSDQSFSTDLLMKLVHENTEYQMEKVMLHSDFSIVSTPNEPIRLNLEPNSELYLDIFFSYEIFDPALNKQSLHQILLSTPEGNNPTIVAQQQLTRVKRTFNCIFGVGHPLKPG